MVDPAQIDRLVERYPDIRSERFRGTHVYQDRRAEALESIQRFLGPGWTTSGS